MCSNLLADKVPKILWVPMIDTIGFTSYNLVNHEITNQSIK